MNGRYKKQIIGASRHGRLRPLSPLLESLSALRSNSLSPAISRHPVPRLPRPVKRGRILIRTLTSNERVHEARVRHARHLDPPAGPTELTAAGSSIHIHTLTLATTHSDSRTYHFTVAGSQRDPGHNTCAERGRETGRASLCERHNREAAPHAPNHLCVTPPTRRG